MKHLRLLFLLACTTCLALPMHALTYSKQDSIQVVKLLEKGLTQPKGTVLTIFYANELMSIPYVHATLEVNPKEQLAINLTQLDCTTLVENVLAFAFTTKAKSTRFSDFCYWLERIRYRDGKLDGYASRNHYFTQWINSNAKMGLVHELQGEKANGYSPFTAQRNIDLHFMTSNPDKYPLLRKEMKKDSKAKPYTNLIRQYEKEASGKVIRYIPHSLLNKGKDVLGCVKDGDILAIVTKKDGLDVSHIGLAVWGKDGKLHLLNASSIHHKVVLEPMTLYQYMSKHPSQLGIRVIRATIGD